MQLPLTAQCLAAASEPPVLHLSYAVPGGLPVALPLRLPLAAHKFMVAEGGMAKDAFFGKWKTFTGARARVCTHACRARTHKLLQRWRSGPCADPSHDRGAAGSLVYIGSLFYRIPSPCTYAGPPLKQQEMVERPPALGPVSIEAATALLRSLNFGVTHLALDPNPQNDAGAALFAAGQPGAEARVLCQVGGEAAAAAAPSAACAASARVPADRGLRPLANNTHLALFSSGRHSPTFTRLLLFATPRCGSRVTPRTGCSSV